MKPAWDKLMDEFKDSKSACVADVDCTVEEELCREQGVEGYPTIKFGDPNNLEDYQGGREFDDLQTFAKEKLGPTCGPKNLDLCSADQKTEIEGFMKLGDADIDAKIKEKEGAISKAESDFKSEVEKLQANYEKLNKDKDKTIADIKKSGLGMLKSVRAAKKEGGTGEKKEL